MRQTTHALKQITRDHRKHCECDWCWQHFVLEDRFNGACEVYDGEAYAETGERCYYLSGSLPREAVDGLGLLIQPDTAYMGKHIDRFGVWAADNGCYAKGEQFKLDRYLTMLDGLREHRATCLFAAAPDVVEDPGATWHRSKCVLPVLREMGYKAALVAQDGVESQLAMEPGMWDRFDVLFIGGSTRWKVDGKADPFYRSLWLELFREAHRRGKQIHMGRVNSWKRYQLAAYGLGCQSVDGNWLKFNPKGRGPHEWVERWNWPYFEPGAYDKMYVYMDREYQQSHQERNGESTLAEASYQRLKGRRIAHG